MRFSAVHTTLFSATTSATAATNATVAARQAPAARCNYGDWSCGIRENNFRSSSVFVCDNTGRLQVIANCGGPDCCQYATFMLRNKSLRGIALMLRAGGAASARSAVAATQLHSRANALLLTGTLPTIPTTVAKHDVTALSRLHARGPTSGGPGTHEVGHLCRVFSLQRGTGLRPPLTINMITLISTTNWHPFIGFDKIHEAAALLRSRRHPPVVSGIHKCCKEAEHTVDWVLDKPIIDYCLRFNIQLVTLPAHSPHLIQPMDVGVFSRFKNEH
ncbi:hypothetical protein GGTG_13470 [Gaeumannomyces tritici R3-111a-1]|uniref:DDE-1 domain-containing protein n=1 Tax=Gaeumannomyces tritici (strain R3-111a-1) TaxID=644352 RepID=J3PIZ0_GAET3|nr:hypothetical protein GGTG_13470 [Gaeumannomyces tritici R3-111a-1]EJT68964.1 hypothetical protein GGTG_13470 [Gaeumannomyces tritici R3-111a-1]